MGVKGLHTFLRPHEGKLYGPARPLSSVLEGKILLVDFPGLLFFLLEHSPPAWPEGLAAITECSPRIVQQLTLFSRQLASEGIQQAWLLDGGFNPCKYDTALSRLNARTPAICRFTARLLQACTIGDTALPYESFQDFVARDLAHTLSLPKYNRNLPTKYLMFRDALESWSIISLVERLMAEGCLLGYECTITEGDARIARLARDGWRGHAVGAVLGQDTDFLVYGCAYAPLDKLKINIDLLTPVSSDRPPTTAECCAAGTFSALFRDIAIQHLADVLQQQGRMNARSVGNVIGLLKRLCSVSRFSCLMPDLATICGNDYYSTEALVTEVFLSHRSVSGPLRSALGGYVDSKMLLKCKLSLYSSPTSRGEPAAIRYADFKAIGAFLVLCIVCEYDSPGGLNLAAEGLCGLLVKKGANRAVQVPRYAAARWMYSVENDLAKNTTPPALERSQFGQMYKELRITRHFGNVVCGPTHRNDVTSLFRLTQFQIPTKYMLEQTQLMYELAALSVWDADGGLKVVDWEAAVRRGEFLSVMIDSLMPGRGDPAVVEWVVGAHVNVTTGHTNYSVQEQQRPLRSTVHPPDPPDAEGLIMKGVGGISLTDGDCKACPNGCGGEQLDCGSQLQRFHWLSVHGKNILSRPVNARRCLLFQALGSGKAAHDCLLASLIHEFTVTGPEAEAVSRGQDIQSTLDLFLLTKRVLVMSYGSYSGGLLANSCSLHRPFMAVMSGYLEGILNAMGLASDNSEPPPSFGSTEWFTQAWRDAEHMRYACRIFSVHLLFHACLEHVLGINDVVGAPLSIRRPAVHLFHLSHAMRHCNDTETATRSACPAVEGIAARLEDLISI